MGCKELETVYEDNFEKLSHELDKEDRQGSREDVECILFNILSRSYLVQKKLNFDGIIRKEFLSCRKCSAAKYLSG